MIAVEIVVRDHMTFIYYRNIYVPNYEEPAVLKSVDFCANKEWFDCIIANNSSTILGVVVSIMQAIA